MAIINNESDSSTRVSEANTVELGVRTYEKPVLVSYGDVRDITLGPTLGTGESGNAAIFRNI